MSRTIQGCDRARSLASWGVFALAVALAGCAPMHAPSPATQAPTATEGVVVVSLTSNTLQAPKFTMIEVRAVKPGTSVDRDGTRYNLVVSNAQLGNATTLFAGTLPEGEYRFDRLTALGNYLLLSEGQRERVGTFRVVAGETADLGRLLVAPVNNLAAVGRSELVTSNAELVKRFAPDITRFYSARVNTGWTAARNAGDVVERYARSRPLGATSLVELPGGEVAAAARVGTVAIRNASGNWRVAGSNGLEALLAVAPYDTPRWRLVAAGELNTVLRMDREGRLHPVDVGNLPVGTIAFIDGNDRVGWFILHRAYEATTLYHTESLDTPAWKDLAREREGASALHGAERTWAWRTTGGFAYAHSNGRIRFYDYATKQWTDRAAPKGHRLVAVQPSAEDVVGIVTSPGGGFGGVFSSTYYTRDRGQTWLEVNSPNKVKVAPPRITSTGTMLEAGGVFQGAGLQGSRDGGKTWIQIVEKAMLGDALWVMPTQGLFLVTEGAQGVLKIENSRDDGVTWRVEASTFDREAYERRRQ